MIIKTKFNIGDKVFSINTNTMKVKKFDVKRITSYTVGDKTSVTLYDSDSYTADGYDESKCFATEKELMDFITTPDEPKTL